MKTKRQLIKEKGKETPQMPFKARYHIKLARPKRGPPQIPSLLGGSHEKA